MANKCSVIQEQCHILHESVLRLRDLAKDFRKKRQPALAEKEKIETALIVLERMIGSVIKVENMKSPFGDVYRTNDLDEPSLETKMIDLESQMKADCAIYRDCGLEKWAANIESERDNFVAFAKETKVQIAEMLQLGWMAMFMPGRQVQYSDYRESMTKKLKPRVTTDAGEQNFANDGVFHDESERMVALIESIEQMPVADIPEGPYLLLVNPSQRPVFGSLSGFDQLRKIHKASRQFTESKKMPIFSIMPPEYSAMQYVFGERTVKMKDNNGEPLFKTLEPIDKETATRFVPDSVLSDPYIPYVFWVEETKDLRYSDDGDFSNFDHGVRLVQRIELKKKNK
jgi:hypothetical protein